MMKQMIPAVGAVLLLAACGGGGDDASSTTQPPTATATGVFIDARVAGLDVRPVATADDPDTATRTDALGRFDYVPGETLAFAVGDIELGRAPGADVVTPLDLVPGATGVDLFADPPAVLNIIRLMLTLDDDFDASNGLQITAQARAVGAGRSLNFAQSHAAFGQDPAVLSYVAAATDDGNSRKASRSLVSAEAAAEHFRQTLAELADGAPNQPPQVTASGPATASDGETVTLTADATDPDGEIANIAWEQIAGPLVTLAGADTAAATFTAPALADDTALTFRVVAVDADGASDADTITVTVLATPNTGGNTPPTADAGADQTVDEQTAVTLDGGNSSDAESSLTYAWRETTDFGVSLADADTAQPSFTAPVTTSEIALVFELTVTDASGAMDTDAVTITVRAVNTPPVAEAGADQTVDALNTVMLGGGNSTDSDGEVVSFAWTAPDSTLAITDSDRANARFTAPDVDEVTTLRLVLTVTDNEGATATDDTEITVLPNQPPVARAGEDQAGEEGETVLLSAAASTDADDEITGYAWTQIGDGPVVELTGADTAVASFTAPDVDADTVLSFSVTVTDARGKSDSDTVAVTVFDIPVGKLRVGAAKASVVPEQQHIDGVEEARVGGTTHVQKFNLGGFGIDPTQNFPDPFGSFGESLTEPASERAHVSDGHGIERTWIRALAMAQLNADGSETRTVFLVLDAVGAGNVIQKNLRAAVAAATDIAPDNIVFGQTHTHAGADLQGLWGGVPQDWINRVLYPAAAVAAAEALDALEPAELAIGSGDLAQWNNYRRPQRTDPEVDSDTLATLMTAVSKRTGRVIGSLLQFNAHPTAINEDPRVPHPDYILGAVDHLEATHPDSVALYFNGPIADASASGPTSGATPYDRVRSRGAGIAGDALGFPVHRVVDSGLSVRHENVTLPVTNPLFVAAGALGAFNRYYNFTPLDARDIPGIGDLVADQLVDLPQLTPTAQTLVTRISVTGGDSSGGLDIVTIPGEATGTFGAFIRSLADPADHVMLLGLTQNSFGYIIPEEEFSFTDASGDAGLIVPFTGYEEFVSLGPLTAPLLRTQAYLPLFDAEDSDNVPPYLAACELDPASDDCIFNILGQRIDYIQRSYAQLCIDNGAPQPFCELLNPDTPLAEPCRDAGLPEGVCAVLGASDGDGGGSDADLVDDALGAAVAGCDIIDPSHCMLPFPSDHFTMPAPAGSIQSAAAGGTGKRINFSPLAMPRNLTGKPIDPTEWNRNDGYSPGQLIITYAPGLVGNDDGTVSGAPPITRIPVSLDVDASAVVVLDAVTGQPHPVWAEIDQNAGLLLPAQGTENPKPKQAALLIRPARNFVEGRRYVVALKDLPAASGGVLRAQQPFATCRDGVTSMLPPVAQRCAALSTDVFPVLEAAGIGVAGNPALYLAWDFTVASAGNNVARLRHMRDDAFVDHLGQTEDADGNIVNLGAAPSFTVERVTDDPGRGQARRIEGTLTIPSYVTPADPAPVGNVAFPLEGVCDSLPQADLADGCKEVVRIADGGSLPPNRLAYNPADGLNPADPAGSRFGDGLPDSTGTMTTRFTCQIPYAASADAPARPGVYGHGLLDGHQAVTYDRVPEFSANHNFLFCGVDLFGFATGDVPNVLSVLVDLSNFQVIPDASQQGLLNFMFLARALRHPDGFINHPAFQDADGNPLFANGEVFYDGNSQGGISGGPVVAMSKDITRGVLGVVGMNYSTLLRRSVDFDGEFEPGGLPPYALPLYLSYPDDLDRDISFSLMQMLWDRSENNGYAHHMTDNAVLSGPDNQLLLHPAFADHQVTHWSAQVMARTIGTDVGDLYFRGPDADVPFTFTSRAAFFAERDPDTAFFWDIPLVGRDAGAAYDDAACFGDCRSTKSAFIEFDEGRTAIPPIGNVPPRADDADPHQYPRNTDFGQCQKSHFLHAQGRVIDVQRDRVVTSPQTCPPLPGPSLVDPGDDDPGPDPDAPIGLDEATCVEAGSQIDPESAQAFCATVFALTPPDVPGFIDQVSQCGLDDTGPNCAFAAGFDNLGGDDLALLLALLAEQCAASGDDVCAAINDGLPDVLPALSRPLSRGSLDIVNSGFTALGGKTVDGRIDDWLGASSHIGGSQHVAAGEHVYTDFIFDARGADDGDDARRLALLGPVIEINDRARRIDQLEQAVGDQLDVPRPVGASDSYGDRPLAPAADLHELRIAVDGNDLAVLATLVKLTDPADADVLLLADTRPGPDTPAAIGFGLSTSQYDLAIRLRAGGVAAWDVASGNAVDLGGSVAVSADSNAIEARLPLAALTRDDVVRLGAVTLDGGVPANVAYRFGEPVAGVYNEQTQALALHAGNIDGFINLIDVTALRDGVDQTVRPGTGYHERQFISAANISTESGENGRLQHYGLFIPSNYDGSEPVGIDYWLHYRGGKAHSGGAWTPRLLRQLGEDHGNIVATPRGRGTSSWYTTDAHQDVFEVMMDVEGMDVSAYAPTVDADTGLANALALNIDTARRYLSGYSMGGYGTYLFGLLYPDLFAAGYSTSGAPSQGAWTGVGPDDAVCAESVEAGGETASPCFVEAGGDANAQLTFRVLENARTLPLAIHHGSNDQLVPVTGIERVTARLTELGYRHDDLRFPGYEHFSQAGVDEWVEGARYMQRFTINPAPRTVTYKVVPALVDAINTVNPDPADARFAFNPDGAFWVDELIVRGVDPANPRDTSVTGMIEATSNALAGSEVLAVPQTGVWPDAPAPSSPVAAPGHSTPFVRRGLEWLEIAAQPISNGFSATLTGLDAATLDVSGMVLDVAIQIDGVVTSDGPAVLTLANIATPVDVYVAGAPVLSAVSGRAAVDLVAGRQTVVLVPAGATPQPTNNTVPGSANDTAQATLDAAQAACEAGGPDPVCDTLAALTGPLGLAADQVLTTVASQCRATTGDSEVCALIADASPQGDGVARAGAAVVDASWHMGASAGQFAETGFGVDGQRGYDPYNHATRKVGSDTLADRITTRALVVEGANGKRIAVATNDLYLPNDLLRRRLAQLLAEHDATALATGGVPTGITEANLAMTVSHSHASPFYSTPAFGTWIFQDVFDVRFYDYMAQQMRDAIVAAVADLRPVRMGGTAVYANDVRGHTYGPKVSYEQRTENTPAGQPYDYTSRQMYVLRFDDAATGDNYANWIVLGIHPEWVWGEEVISGDLTHATMRLLDRETGAINLMSQSETGASGPHKDERAHRGSERHEFQEAAFAGAHRAARMAADNVHGALDNMATGTAWDVNQHAPMRDDFAVDFAFQRFAPPVTRPIPGVSNCNSDRLFYDANPGIPAAGLPDCQHVGDDVSGGLEEGEAVYGPIYEAFPDALREVFPTPPETYDAVTAGLASITGQLVDQLTAMGVPVPVSYSATTLGLVEEQATVPIQAFKLGDVGVTFCPCEQFTDPALNVISRLNRVAGDVHTGWDWDLGYAADNPLRDPANNGDFVHGADEVGCTVNGDTVTCPSPRRGNDGVLTMTRAAFDRMKAQIHNDAAGWDDELVRAGEDGTVWTPLHAEAEPDEVTAIKGNFTHAEHTEHGYGLVIPVGMANDYWGYMPAYREYRAHDHYRKALAGLGPHGADFLATRMSRLAASLNGGQGMAASPRDIAYIAESGRAETLAYALGAVGVAANQVYDLTQPVDGGTAGIITQPSDIERFDAATVQWIGGATWLGMPEVTVQRQQDGVWVTVGDQTGEVAIHVDFLAATPVEGSNGFQGAVIPDPEDFAAWRAGEFEWVWTAAYEGFASEVPVTDADAGQRPDGPYATPTGTYRFVINGQRQSLPGRESYSLTSAPFTIQPWGGITVADSPTINAGTLRFDLGPSTEHTVFQRGADTRDPTEAFGPRTVGPIDYPDTWAVVREGGEALLPWVRDERNLYPYASGDEEQYCHRCTFRPWIDTGVATAVTVMVGQGDNATPVAATSSDGIGWQVAVDGAAAWIEPGGIVDAFGNTNRGCIDLVGEACAGP